jgi:hypothetical protein
MLVDVEITAASACRQEHGVTNQVVVCAVRSDIEAWRATGFRSAAIENSIKCRYF